MQDSSAALVDVMAAISEGNRDQARRELSQIGTALGADLASHILLLDRETPAETLLRLDSRFGPPATAMYRRYLAGAGDPLIEEDLAVFSIGRRPLPGPAGPDSAALLHRHAIDVIAAADFPDLGFTPVELRLIFLLVAGCDLREVAAIDGVGYETRRGQLKTVMSKLHVARQSDLVRMFLGRLLVQAGGREPAPEDMRGRQFFEVMAGPGLGQARPFMVTGRDGRQIRVVEMGPKTGQPVIVLHPMAFPVTTAAEVQAFHDQGIRALWPVRDGALSGAGGPHLSPTQQIDACCADIASLHELFCDGPVTLLGLMSGAIYATEAARRMPERIGALGLVGTCYRPRLDGSAGGALRRGLFGLVRNNPGLMMVALRLVADRMARPDQHRRMLERHYAGSAGDLAVIAQSLRDGSLKILMQRFALSLASLRNDFYLQAGFDWAALRDLPQPLHFIHGAEDPFHPVAALEDFVRRLPQGRLAVLEGTGQLMLGTHFARALALAAAIPGTRATAPP